MTGEITISILAILSIGLHIWQYGAGRRFHFRRSLKGVETLPAVSILKPIGSVDEFSGQCLASWLEQDYEGVVELVFGVDSDNRRTREAIEALLASHPHAAARLILCPPSSASNPKVAKLIELEKHARWDCLVVSDADVHVRKDFLSCAITEFVQSDCGLACCLYRLFGGASYAQKLECDANNIDFWSQVTQARSLWPIDFALGAAMVFHRSSLEKIGGFEALADYIADDFELGNRLHKQGEKILISSVPVDCRHSSVTLRDILRRQIRWARTMRICKPVPYFFSILANPTLWPLAYFLMAPSDLDHSVPFVIWVLLRILVAKDLSRRFLETNKTTGTEGLTPIRDLIQAIVWATAFTGNRIVWSGRAYRLTSAGIMKAENPEC